MAAAVEGMFLYSVLSFSFAILCLNLFLVGYEIIRIVSFLPSAILNILKFSVFTSIWSLEVVLGHITSKQVLFPLFTSLIYVMCTLEVFFGSLILPSSKFLRQYIISNISKASYVVINVNFVDRYVKKPVLKSSYFNLQTLRLLKSLNSQTSKGNTWLKDVYTSQQNFIKLPLSLLKISILQLFYPFRRLSLWLYRKSLRAIEGKFVDEIEGLFLSHIVCCLVVLVGIDNESFFKYGVVGGILDVIESLCLSCATLIMLFLQLLPFVIYTTISLIMTSRVKHDPLEGVQLIKVEEQPFNYFRKSDVFVGVEEQSFNDFGKILLNQESFTKADVLDASI